MAAPNPEKRRRAGRIAAIARHHGHDDPRLGDLRAEMLTEHVRKLVDAAPPLTPEQRARLAAILAAAADTDGGGAG